MTSRRRRAGGRVSVDVDDRVLGGLLRTAVDEGVAATPSLLELSWQSSKVSGQGMQALQAAVDEACDRVGPPHGEAGRELLKLRLEEPPLAVAAASRRAFNDVLGRRSDRQAERVVCALVAHELVASIRVQPWWRRPAWIPGFLGLNLLSVLGTVLAFQPFLPADPVRLAGEVNVAVVHQSLESERREAQLRTLATSVAVRLADQAEHQAGGPEVAVLAPSETEPVELDDALAEELLPEVARRHSADIVVLVKEGPDALSIATDVHVERYAVEGGEELAGTYEFGAPLLLGGASRAAAGGRVSEALTDRAAQLVHFVDGLGGLQRREFDYARKSFERSVRSADEQELSIRALSNLFLGNTWLEIAARETTGFPAALRGASAAFRAGRLDDAASPRLELGLLQVEYLGANGGCRPSTADAIALDDVRRRLHELRDGLIGPPVVLARTDMTLARTELCLLLAGATQDRDAVEGRLRSVLQVSAGEGRILQEIAAEAHMDLAAFLTSRPFGVETNVEAREHYEQARRMAVDPFRRAVATFRLALLLRDDGDVRRAGQLLLAAEQLSRQAAHPVLAEQALDQYSRLGPAGVTAPR